MTVSIDRVPPMPARLVCRVRGVWVARKKRIILYARDSRSPVLDPTHVMTFAHRTERLLLRQWREEDRVPLAVMNADADVMRYFPRRYTSVESDEFVRRNAQNITERGWGNWAVEIVGNGEFTGFVGLSQPADWHPCAGRIEIGWRLDARHWGRGYATEAARHVLEIGFKSLGLDEIFSWTSVPNHPSIAVMERLGMRQETVGFDHPRIPQGDPLRPHVVYRLTREQWRHVRAKSS